MRVAAAIPTFNRLESLKRCLESVRAQSRPVDEIIVLDNASQDGTGAWLAEQSGLVVLPQSVNHGPGPGFSMVVRSAYDRGHDWVFLMDDDVYPTPEALERLLEAAETLQAQGVKLGALQSFDAKWHKGGPTRVPFSFPSTARRAWTYMHNSYEMEVEMGRDAPVEIDLFTFVGILISREALSEAGFPDPDFVYWCDDSELACRQRSLGFHHYLVPRAVVLHKGDEFTARYRRPPKIDWQHYYIHRNRWQFLRLYGHLLGQPMKLACQARMTEQMLRHVAASIKNRNQRGARLVLQGVVDGVLGRMGKRVQPTAPSSPHISRNESPMARTGA